VTHTETHVSKPLPTPPQKEVTHVETEKHVEKVVAPSVAPSVAPKITPTPSVAPLSEPMMTTWIPTAPLESVQGETYSRMDRPAAIHETIEPVETVEVQQVIERDIEQPVIKEVIQPIREHEVAPTEYRRVEVAPQSFEYFSPGNVEKTVFSSDVVVQPVQHHTIEKPAIIHEHIHRTVVEEIQPVVYRETIKPVVVQETHPIHERIVEPTILVKEYREPLDLGVHTNVPAEQMRGLHISEPAQPISHSTHPETTIVKEVTREPLSGYQEHRSPV
jgi:hypothetical protein